MKYLKGLGCVLFFVISYSSVEAQTITMYKTFGGVRFERDTVIITLRQVSDLLSVNPPAYEEFKKARINYSTSGILGFSGGLILAFPIVTIIAGGDPEWIYAGIGAGLIVSSIPFTKAFTRLGQSALNKYNQGMKSSRAPRLSWRFTGHSVQLRF